MPTGGRFSRLGTPYCEVSGGDVDAREDRGPGGAVGLEVGELDGAEGALALEAGAVADDAPALLERVRDAGLLGLTVGAGHGFLTAPYFSGHRVCRIHAAMCHEIFLRRFFIREFPVRGPHPSSPTTTSEVAN